MADEIEEAVVEPTEESSSTEVDYEAVALAEQERANAAEALIIKNKRIEKRNEEEPVDEEDRPITKRELASFLQSERHATQKELKEVQALSIARANTSSETEAQAALVFWKNRVIPTGSLEEDIKFAIGGLNQKKITSKVSELKRALAAKDTVTTDDSTAQRDPLPAVAPKLSASSPLVGFEHKGNGIYAKKLQSGKTMYRNTKALGNERKTWVE